MLGQHLENDRAVVITNARPLSDLAGRLQKVYRTVVTYEDPVLRWRNELAVRDDGRGLLPWPRDRRFVVPPALLDAVNMPELGAGTLSKAVEAYNRQNSDGAQFGVTSSRLGLHIVPVKVNDENGKLVAAHSVLDAEVMVPVGRRMPSEQFRALCDVVAAATGIGMELFYPNLDQVFKPNGLLPPRAAARMLPAEEKEQYQIAWGTGRMAARDAVEDLIWLSPTRLTWDLRCESRGEHLSGDCVLNMRPGPGQP